VEERTVRQWPSLGLRTKNDKTATTYLLEIPDLLTTVTSWGAFARARMLSTAMWYPPVISHWGEQEVSAAPPRRHRNMNVARRIRGLFEAVGLSYKSPQKFRHGHAVYALQQARTMTDYKAVSMSLMHSDIRVTDSIYAPLASSKLARRWSAGAPPRRPQRRVRFRGWGFHPTLGRGRFRPPAPPAIHPAEGDLASSPAGYWSHFRLGRLSSPPQGMGFPGGKTS